MCMPATRDKVISIVTDLIKATKPFTAYEVTVIARQEHGVTEPHYQLKKIVHALFESGSMGSYEKTLADFNGAQAFTYHPNAIDGQTRHANGAAATVNSLSVIDDADDEDAVSKTINAGADVLYVPRFMVKGLGLNIGDDAFVLVNTGRVTVRGNSNHGGSRVSVDQRHNIRVTTASLQKAGINSQRVTLKSDANAITITA